MKIVFLLLFSQAITQSGGDGPAMHNAGTQSARMARAFLKNDFPTFTHYTYPPLLKMMGGAARMAEVLKKAKSGMEQQGDTLVNDSVGDPISLVKTPSSWQCVIPEYIDLGTSKGVVTSMANLIGVSADHGKTWTFLDAGKKDLETLRKSFPELNPQLSVPKAF